MSHNRIDVVRLLLRLRGYRRYLEIGCQNNVCFQAIDAPLDVKIGLDPISGGTHRTTSDAFFTDLKANRPAERFDLVFVDGDHHHAQALRDAENALSVLAPGGCLVMHDVLPGTREYEGPLWCSTAWRAFAKLREHPQLDGVSGDFDHGVGVIHRGPNPEPIVLGKSLDALTYDDFTAHRAPWMRPVSFDYLHALAAAGWDA